MKDSLVVRMAFLQGMLQSDMKAEQRWASRVEEAQQHLTEAHTNRANTERQILQLLGVYNEH